MMRSKNAVLAFILLSLASIYAGTTSKTSHSTITPPRSGNPTLPVDTFQILIDQYAKLLASNELLKNEIHGLNQSISNCNASISECKKNLLALEQKRNKLPKDSLSSTYKKEEAKYLKQLKSLEDALAQKQLGLTKKETQQAQVEIKYKTTLTQVQLAARKIVGSKKIKFNNIHCNLYVADLDADNIQLHWKDNAGKIYSSIDNVYDQLKKQNSIPQMITNAGMYKTDLSPQGLYIENYKRLVPLDTTKPNSNNFYLKPNGVFFIDSSNVAGIVTTENFEKESERRKIKWATQSGPLLVIDGAMHKLFTNGSKNLKIRSGVGIENEKKVVFIISDDEINFYDFSLIFRNIFDCKNALFLDGAISRMYLEKLNPNEKGGEFGAIISVTKKMK